MNSGPNRKLGLLTGGGDAPGLNAVIRAVTRAATGLGMEAIGVLDGFQGLVEGRFLLLDRAATRGLIRRGGTILGTTNRSNPFSHRELGGAPRDREQDSGKSFAPVEDVLEPGSNELVFAPIGGRSSDGHLPFFNLAWRGGVALAIGWSGQWEARFRRSPEGPLTMQAGQELVRCSLHPGESIRTPRILLVFWDGTDPLRGNNLLRQVLMAHFLPRRNGQLVLSPICASVNWTAPDGSYEEPHVSVMQPLARRGIEVFWSDMGPQQWYPKGFPEGTGTWADPA